LLEGEESDGGDAWKLAYETCHRAELFLAASRDRDHDGAGTLIAEVFEDVIE